MDMASAEQIERITRDALKLEYQNASLVITVIQALLRQQQMQWIARSAVQQDSEQGVTSSSTRLCSTEHQPVNEGQWLPPEEPLP